MPSVLLITLVVLSICDIKYRRIPNAIVYSAVAIKILYDTISHSPEIIKNNMCLFFIGILIILSYVILKTLRVKVSGGDLKLIYLILVYMGIDTGLEVILLSCLFSIIPLAFRQGKIPMAPYFFIGYIVYFNI